MSDTKKPDPLRFSKEPYFDSSSLPDAEPDLLAENAALRASLADAEKERDEAIKAHGYMWNVVREVAQSFRWLGIPSDEAGRRYPHDLSEIAPRVFEGERLTPKWSTDWALVPQGELVQMEIQRKCFHEQAAQLATANQSLAEARTTIERVCQEASHEAHLQNEAQRLAGKYHDKLTAAEAEVARLTEKLSEARNRLDGQMKFAEKMDQAILDCGLKLTAATSLNKKLVEALEAARTNLMAPGHAETCIECSLAIVDAALAVARPPAAGEGR